MQVWMLPGQDVEVNLTGSNVIRCRVRRVLPSSNVSTVKTFAVMDLTTNKSCGVPSARSDSACGQMPQKRGHTPGESSVGACHPAELGEHHRVPKPDDSSETGRQLTVEGT